jgi:hypothetical protein
MSQDQTRPGIYEQLPLIFRMRDAEQGRPVRALLEAIEAQAGELTADIDQLYDNWFIETCDDSLVGYFAELVGLDLGSAAQSSPDTRGFGADAVWRRRQVANAIADRRRKGSFSVLEDLAADATGWPARAVELARVVLGTQSISLPDVGRRTLLDTAEGDSLAVIGTPLSDAAPLADMRRLRSHRTPGSANPGSVAVWLWRLVAEPLQRAPAPPIGEDGRYAFDQLGRDTQLAVLPAKRSSGASPASDLDVPTPITRRALERRLEDYYGPARSLCVYRGREPVPRSQIVVADLTDDRARTPTGHVSIDPELGRIGFPARHAPEDGVYVSYGRLGVGAIGGGAYERRITGGPTVYRVGARTVGTYKTIGAALKAWREANNKQAAPSVAIEIIDDGIYEERFEIKLTAGERLELRAAQGRRPILVPLETSGNRPARFRVQGVIDEPDEQQPDAPDGAEPPAPPLPAPVLVVDGLWIASHPLEFDGRFGGVKLRHCTLVPPGRPTRGRSDRGRHGPSLVVRAMSCPISIVSSVVGRIRVESPEAGHDPLPLSIADTVLDASDPAGRAVLGTDERPAWVSLTLQRVTVLGGAHVHCVELVEESIVAAPIDCERCQQGVIRFSYIAPGSRTPQRTACQPDDGLATADMAAADAGASTRERARVVARELRRLAPRFDGTEFGDPAYARLCTDVAWELARGAHDEGELGAYHDLWEALRVRDLTTRLQEFAPAETDIDIRFAT